MTQMKHKFLSICLLGLSLASAPANGDTSGVKSDNTKKNRGTSPTAEEQSNNKGDVEVVANIRKAIVADSKLSTYAHNIKIIAQGNEVELVGPVRTSDERNEILRIAQAAAGKKTVRDKLSVAPDAKEDDKATE